MSTKTETEKVISTITVPEGQVVRIYEQTASRDHNATLVPGTYEVREDRSPEGFLNGYRASIPADAAAYTASTVEFGGVALAWEDRAAERVTYGWHMYADAYFIESAERAGFVFGYKS